MSLYATLTASARVCIQCHHAPVCVLRVCDVGTSSAGAQVSLGMDEDDKRKEGEHRALVEEIRKLVTAEAKRLIDSGVPISEISERSRAIATEKTHAAIARVMGDALLSDEELGSEFEAPQTSQIERRANLHDPRLPPVGAVIEHWSAGKLHEVKVLPHGFEYAGQFYRNLSAVARVISGHRPSGFMYFAASIRKAKAKHG